MENIWFEEQRTKSTKNRKEHGKHMNVLQALTYGQLSSHREITENGGYKF